MEQVPKYRWNETEILSTLLLLIAFYIFSGVIQGSPMLKKALTSPSDEYASIEIKIKCLLARYKTWEWDRPIKGSSNRDGNIVFNPFEMRLFTCENTHYLQKSCI